jgi:hypothetical protein
MKHETGNITTAPNELAALGDPLWTTSQGIYEQVNWFAILCNLHFEDVSYDRGHHELNVLMIL